MTIAIIEDDPSIGDLLEQALRREGYETVRAFSGTEAQMLLERLRPDLALLDLMLPGLSGEALLPHLTGIPVIVVSAKVGVDDKVSALLGGAADYVTKPFSLRELMARIAVQLRGAGGSRALYAGALRLDPDTREVRCGAGSAHLTRTEFAILKLLLQNPGQVIAKSVLLDRISLDTPDCTESSLKQHISNLRKKVRDAGGGDCIESVWGIGFRLKPVESELS